MRIAVTGSSGLIGSALLPAARDAGHEVVRLVRREASGPDEIRWDPPRGELDPADLAGVDAVVHLAGAGVRDHRWTPSYQATVLASRVDGTRTVSTALADALARDGRPRTLLSASGIDFYGDTGDRVVDETDPPGTGFLAGVCRQWEASTEPARAAGVRVATLRTGLVLAPNGGLLGPVLPLFRLGLGGRLGSGRQYWSWVSMADEVAAMLFLLAHPEVSGPVNLTGPVPVTNAEFTSALGRVVGRPTLLPVPGLALRIALGGFADEAVLAGKRVLPRALGQAGFRFRHGTVEEALRWAVRDP
ncbi:MAG TPA: TIGR01777 family oxidoreductase [Mycobacteriales bacterium]|nr:TIGR01777 family oxidoreductase [Mycobacteriales bacterium]